MPAEIFEEAGYRTIGIYRNGWVSGYFGFKQGFDVYVKPSTRPIPPSIRREHPTLTGNPTRRYSQWSSHPQQPHNNVTLHKCLSVTAW